MDKLRTFKTFKEAYKLENYLSICIEKEKSSNLQNEECQTINLKLNKIDIRRFLMKTNFIRYVKAKLKTNSQHFLTHSKLEGRWIGGV